MLIGFTMKNYASYKDEVVFSMMTSRKKEFEDFNTFLWNDIRLLKSALIYGPNGSGKTNFIDGLNFMKDMVGKSVLDSSLINDFEPFKFNVNSAEKPTLFEVTFIQNHIYYTYGFEILNGKIQKEWLYKKNKRKVRLFERESPSWESIKTYGDMKEAEDIKRYTKENSLFITIADMLNITIAKEVNDWFSKLMIIGPNFSSPGPTVHYIEKDAQNKNKILEYLKRADLRIEDIELQVEDMEIDNEMIDIFLKEQKENSDIDNIKIKLKQRSVDLKTIHNVYNDDKKIVDRVKLPIEYQSQGTLKFFEIIGPIIEALESGGILVVDEIDSKLHCELVRFTLSLFNSIDKNPNNAQLICNTHDVLLLEEDIRRDQIWFVEKNKFGESELYSLDDFPNVRKNDPKLKKYLLGVYGAIPQLLGSEYYE